MARENIRTLRKLKNLSQGSLAKAARLTASEISRIECGYRDLSLSEASAIAKALGVEVREIADTPCGVSAAVNNVGVEEAGSEVTTAIPPPTPVPGNDLSDPANFREMPDFDLLKQGRFEAGVFRTRLRLAVDRATKILHTSKVPAAVWRAWREFEKGAQEMLRQFASDSTTAMGASALRTNGRFAGEVQESSDALALAEQSFRIGRSSKVRHQQKSYNAVFLEAARRILPSDVEAKLTAAAEQRLQRERSMGFMHHFRNAAEETLSPVELSRILAAIGTHEAEQRRGCLLDNPAKSSFN